MICNEVGFDSDMHLRIGYGGNKHSIIKDTT